MKNFPSADVHSMLFVDGYQQDTLITLNGCDSVIFNHVKSSSLAFPEAPKLK